MSGLWRVTVVDGLFRRFEGWGVVRAASEAEARTVVAEYLSPNTAYGKPFEVSNVEPYDYANPHVLVYEWGDPVVWPRKHDDYDDDPEQASVHAVGPVRFTAPDHQVFFARRVGRHYAFWLEGDEDQREEAYYEPNDRNFALVPLAGTLGFKVGRDGFPPWLNALESTVVHELWGDHEPT